MICIHLLLAAFSAFAFSNSDALKDLNIPKDRVSVSASLDGLALEDGEKIYMVTIDVHKPINFLNGKIGTGSVIYYQSDVGLTGLVPARGTSFEQDGFACERDIGFKKKRICSCILSKPYRIGRDVSLPIGTRVGVSGGRPVWAFFLTDDLMETDATGKRRHIKSPISLGGVKIENAKSYRINGSPRETLKRSESSFNPISFCGLPF